MYANLRVKPRFFEAINVCEVRIEHDRVVIVEDENDGESYAVPGTKYTVLFSDIPEGGIVVTANF